MDPSQVKASDYRLQTQKNKKNYKDRKIGRDEKKELLQENVRNRSVATTATMTVVANTASRRTRRSASRQARRDWTSNTT